MLPFSEFFEYNKLLANRLWNRPMGEGPTSMMRVLKYRKLSCRYWGLGKIMKHRNSEIDFKGYFM